MTRVLLIDNGSRHGLAFAHRLEGFTVQRVKYSHLTDAHIAWAQVFVLSGGHPAIIHHYWFFRRQIELIRTTRKPVIGVCLGFELVARSFEARLIKVPRKIHGQRVIALERPILGTGKLEATVWEAHRWVVRSVPEEFEVLATSRTGIELIRHRTRPIVACQFHPEVLEPGTDGAAILVWMLAQVTRKP